MIIKLAVAMLLLYWMFLGIHAGLVRRILCQDGPVL